MCLLHWSKIYKITRLRDKRSSRKSGYIRRKALYFQSRTSRSSDIFIRHQYYQRNIVIIEKSIPNFSKNLPSESKKGVFITQVETLRNIFSRAKIYSTATLVSTQYYLCRRRRGGDVTLRYSSDRNIKIPGAISAESASRGNMFIFRINRHMLDNALIKTIR